MANEKHQIDVELEEAVAQGTYANLAIISHSTSEFVLDFAAVLPGVPKAKVKSRIILAPEHAKRLLLSLQENIARYEANVGRINIPQGGSKEGIKGFNIVRCRFFTWRQPFRISASHPCDRNRTLHAILPEFSLSCITYNHRYHHDEPTSTASDNDICGGAGSGIRMQQRGTYLPPDTGMYRDD